MITLICGKESKKFPIGQAQGILYIQGQMKLKGWELPADSPYEYKDNALIKRANTKDCKESEKGRPVVEGEKPRRETKVSRRDDTPET